MVEQQLLAVVPVEVVLMMVMRVWTLKQQLLLHLQVNCQVGAMHAFQQLLTWLCGCRLPCAV
jgi:hypothetical protein